MAKWNFHFKMHHICEYIMPKGRRFFLHPVCKFPRGSLRCKWNAAHDEPLVKPSRTLLTIQHSTFHVQSSQFKRTPGCCLAGADANANQCRFLCRHTKQNVVPRLGQSCGKTREHYSCLCQVLASHLLHLSQKEQRWKISSALSPLGERIPVGMVTVAQAFF